MNSSVSARDFSIRVFIHGSVWYNGNRMPPETGYHCVFSGSALDFYSYDHDDYEFGAESEFDHERGYIVGQDGVRYDDFADLPVDWD